MLQHSQHCHTLPNSEEEQTSCVQMLSGIGSGRFTGEFVTIPHMCLVEVAAYWKVLCVYIVRILFILPVHIYL